MNSDTGTTPARWYYKPLVIFMAVLAAGPFALPLVWTAPSLKLWHKVTVTLLLLALTIWLVKSGVELYGILLKELRSLSEIK